MWSNTYFVILLTWYMSIVSILNSIQHLGWSHHHEIILKIAQLINGDDKRFFILIILKILQLPVDWSINLIKNKSKIIKLQCNYN